MERIRRSPEPFYCYYKDKDTYAPFNTLKAVACSIQCIVCENYQDGGEEYFPIVKYLPVPMTHTPDTAFLIAYIDQVMAEMERITKLLDDIMGDRDGR